MSLSNQIVRPSLITPGNASYASVVLADKPVAFYLLNETAGIVAHDASGHGNTGTLQGGVTLNQGGAFNGAAAMAFDGSTGYIQANATDLPAMASPQSREIWAYAKSFSLENDLLDVLGSNIGTQFQVTEGSLRVSDYGGGIVIETSSSAVSLNRWYHLAWTFDGTTSSLYINGILNTTSTSLPPSGTPTSVFIGSYGSASGNGFWDGSLEEAALYDYALTAAQVQAHYNAGRAALRMTGGMIA